MIIASLFLSIGAFHKCLIIFTAMSDIIKFAMKGKILALNLPMEGSGSTKGYFVPLFEG